MFVIAPSFNSEHCNRARYPVHDLVQHVLYMQYAFPPTVHSGLPTIESTQHGIGNKAWEDDSVSTAQTGKDTKVSAPLQI